MRTTISIENGLLGRAKEVAASSGRTLSAVVEDALRESLNRPGRDRHEETDLPRFSGRFRGGVDLDDSAALLELMDAPPRG